MWKETRRGKGSSEDSSEEEEEVFAAAAETRAWLKAQEEDHRGRSLGEWGVDGTASQSISSPSAGGGGGGGGVSVEEQHRASDAWLMEAALETAVLQGETCMFPPCFALLDNITANIPATTATVAAGNSEGRDTAQHADAGKQEAEEIPPWGPMLPFCTSVGDRDPLALPLMRQRDANTAHSARLRLQDQCSQPKDIPVISLHDAVESIQSNPQSCVPLSSHRVGGGAGGCAHGGLQSQCFEGTAAGPPPAHADFKCQRSL